GQSGAVGMESATSRQGANSGLLGHNGAGTSPLNAVLATLAAPTSGTVRYGGRTAPELGAALRARIGLLAHELFLYPELSARQNLTFFAQLYGLEATTVVPAALDSAGLTDRADDDVAGFSRGMRQRLALERALPHRARPGPFGGPLTRPP